MRNTLDLDLPEFSDMNSSIVGGVVHQISVILNGTMYTVVYDPPLKRDDKFFQPEEIQFRIPARIDGDHLTIRWRTDKSERKNRSPRKD